VKLGDPLRRTLPLLDAGTIRRMTVLSRGTNVCGIHMVPCARRVMLVVPTSCVLASTWTTLIINIPAWSHDALGTDPWKGFRVRWDKTDGHENGDHLRLTNSGSNDVDESMMLTYFLGLLDGWQSVQLVRREGPRQHRTRRDSLSQSP
jgi:hypothetical protein